MRYRIYIYGVALLFYFLFACNLKKRKQQDAGSVPKINFQVVNKYNHNTDYFTQGLIYQDGKILESTGQYGHSLITSYLLREDIEATEKKLVELSAAFFGEGISVFNRQLFQLTWKDYKLFIYDYPSMRKLKTHKVRFEGWGLTHDDTYLILSDGTSTIRWLDPVSLKTIKKVKVHDNYGSLDYINELELINGYLYANRWQTNTIIKIDTSTGQVIGNLDISYLSLEAKAIYAQSDVANGIAFLPGSNTLLVTGKYWPFLYEIKLEN